MSFHSFAIHRENCYSNFCKEGSKGLKRKVNLSVSQARSQVSSLPSTFAYLTFSLALSIYLIPKKNSKSAVPSLPHTCRGIPINNCRKHLLLF